MDIELSRGFVAFPRGLTDWEWYTDANTARLYFHLLLTANYKEKQWQGITIHSGELVTSRTHLAKQLHLSERQIRTALNHLKSTSCIAIKSGPKYSVITIKHYSSITFTDPSDVQQPTSQRPATDHNLTKITKTTKEQSSSTTGTRTTTHPCVQEFQRSIGRLNANGKAELAACADRLGEELVNAVIAKCADLGAHSWAYVRKALAEAEAQGCKSAEEYRKTNPIGGSRAKGIRVDRAEPSGNNWLAAAPLDRARRRARMFKQAEGG